MSCSRTGARAGIAGLRAGISRLQGQFNQAAGNLLGRVQSGLGRASTGTLAVADSFDLPSPETVWGATILAASIGGGKTERNLALNLTGAAKLTSLLSAGVGTGLARLSRTDKAGLAGGSRR